MDNVVASSATRLTDKQYRLATETVRKMREKARKMGLTPIETIVVSLHVMTAVTVSMSRPGNEANLLRELHKNYNGFVLSQIEAWEGQTPEDSGTAIGLPDYFDSKTGEKH